MNGLDSPIESLAFIPLNLGPLFSAAVNNIWAWVAVITAAVSFWRLRTTSSLKTTSSEIFLSPPPPTHQAPTTTRTTPFIRKGGVNEEERENENENENENGEEEVVLTRGNSKKFFTVFYEERENDQDKNEDDEMDGGDEEEEDEVEEENEWVVITRWGPSSELTVEMRGGDFGWYNYQNRKVIDGSVVRLWGEEGESGWGGSSPPRSCRKRTLRKNFVNSSRKLSPYRGSYI